MIQKNGFMFDDSSVGRGFIRVLSKQCTKRYKIRFVNQNQEYTYDLNNRGEYDTYPLQMGDGAYLITVYVQTSGTRYRKLFSFKLRVKCNPMSPYLHPNQYVWYTENSMSTMRSRELCDKPINDKDKIEAVCSYVKNGFLYDHMKAILISSLSQYLPNLDEIIKSKKGICFDFAALICAMLRVQGIPTKLVIGYADNKHHAWNSVYVDGQWRLIDITKDIAKMNVRRYAPKLYY